jgi:transposase
VKCAIFHSGRLKSCFMFGLCFFFKATFQMTDLTHLCTMLPEIAAQIVALNNDDRRVRYIAQHLNIPRSIVQDTLSRFRETHGFTRRPGSGRSRSTTDRDYRFLCLSVSRDRGLPSTIPAGRLVDAREVIISVPTVRKRLQERGLSAKTPATGPRLTVEHRRARLEFAHQYVNWGDNEWKNGVFVDNGAMTAHRYILECIEPHVVPYAPFIDENFVFMDDNTHPHMARIVVRYLEQVGIRRLPWSANSPDLNRIEHVWDFLSKRVRRRQLRPETLNGLRVALQEE